MALQGQLRVLEAGLGNHNTDQINTRIDERLGSMSLSRPPCPAKVRQSAGHLWFDIAADWLRKWYMKNWIGSCVSPHVRECGFRSLGL